jgi:hypothetical protein
MFPTYPVSAGHPHVRYALHASQHGGAFPGENSLVDVLRGWNDLNLFHVLDQGRSDRLQPTIPNRSSESFRESSSRSKTPSEEEKRKGEKKLYQRRGRFLSPPFPLIKLARNERKNGKKEAYLLSRACAIPGVRAVPPTTRTACKYFRILSSPPAARALLNIATSKGSLLASSSRSIWGAASFTGCCCCCGCEGTTGCCPCPGCWGCGGCGVGCFDGTGVWFFDSSCFSLSTSIGVGAASSVAPASAASTTGTSSSALIVSPDTGEGADIDGPGSSAFVTGPLMRRKEKEKGNTIQPNMSFFPLARLDRADKGGGIRNRLYSPAGCGTGSGAAVEALDFAPSGGTRCCVEITIACVWGGEGIEKRHFAIRIFSPEVPNTKGMKGWEEQLTNLSVG